MMPHDERRMNRKGKHTMTQTTDILDDIALGEDENREFKQTIDNAESLASEIVAFANSNGGTLYIGVDDTGNITGLDNPDVAFQTITNICRDRCIPPISPVCEQQNVQGKDILILAVKPDLNWAKPYRTAGGRFYIRSGRDKKDATGRELMRIAQAAGELHYDESPLITTTMDDLSLDAFADYHEKQFGLTLEEHLA